VGLGFVIEEFGIERAADGFSAHIFRLRLGALLSDGIGHVDSAEMYQVFNAVDQRWLSI